MKNTKLFTLMIVLISLITISAVSAEEISLDEYNTLETVDTTISITNETYSTYFNSDGDIIDNINDGDIIDLSGNFDLVKFNITKQVTLTSLNNNAILTNSTIYLEPGSDGSTVSNLKIYNLNTESTASSYSIGINCSNTNNINIINNYIDCENPNAIPLRLDCSNNAKIENNTIKNGIITSWGKNAAIVLFTSDDAIINNNTIIDGYCNGIYFSWWGGVNGGGFSYRAKITNNKILSYYKESTGKNPDSYNYAIQYMGCDGYIANNLINGTFRGVSGVGFWGLSNPYNNTMVNNTLTNICGDYAIYGNLNSIIGDNTITDSTSNGIWIENGNVNVYNNSIDVTKNGITISSFNATIAPDSNYTVENNNIIAGGYGVYIDCNKLYTSDIKIIRNNISSKKETVFNRAQSTSLAINVEHILISENNISSSAKYAINLKNKIDDVNVTNNYIISKNYQGNDAVYIETVNDNYVNSGNTPTNSNTNSLRKLVKINLLGESLDDETSNIVEVTSENVDTFTSSLKDGDIVVFTEDFSNKKFRIKDSVIITSNEDITLEDCVFRLEESCILENLTISNTEDSVIEILSEDIDFTMKNCKINAFPEENYILIDQDEKKLNKLVLENNDINIEGEYSVTIFKIESLENWQDFLLSYMTANEIQITKNKVIIKSGDSDYYDPDYEDWSKITGFIMSSPNIEFAYNTIVFDGDNTKPLGIYESTGENINIHDNNISMECTYGTLIGYTTDVNIYYTTPVGFFTASSSNVNFFRNNISLTVKNEEPEGYGPNAYATVLLTSQNINFYDNILSGDSTSFIPDDYSASAVYNYVYLMTNNACTGLNIHDNIFNGKAVYCSHGIQSLSENNGEYYNNVFNLNTDIVSYGLYLDGMPNNVKIHDNTFISNSGAPYGITMTTGNEIEIKDNNFTLTGDYTMGIGDYGASGVTITGNNIICEGNYFSDSDLTTYPAWINIYQMADRLGRETVGVKLMGKATDYTITDNVIITTQNYAIDLTGQSTGNTITDNILISKELEGDESVNGADKNTVENNKGTITPVLTINSVSGETGSSATVRVSVKDEDGDDIDGGSVTISFNGADTVVDVVKGVASTRLTLPSRSGTYDIIAKYTNDLVYYNDGEANGNVRVTNPVVPTPKPSSTTISVSSVSGEVGDNSEISISVSSSNGNTVSGSVEVKFNGISETLSLINGSATYSFVLPDTSGEYEISVSYTGNSNFASSSATGLVTVVEKPVDNGTDTNITDDNNTGDNSSDTNITEDPLKTSISLRFIENTDGQELIGKIVDENNNPVSSEISITITTLATKKDDTYTVASDSNGEFKLDLNLESGDYTGKAVFSGNDKYLESSSKVSICIAEIPSTVIIEEDNEVVGTYGEENEFSGVLTDTEGNSISNQQIALNITRLSSGASKVYYVTTDENGNYELPINLAPGVYTVRTIVNSGNLTGSSLSSLIINDENTDVNDEREVSVLNTKNTNLELGDGGNFTGRLMDELGYGLAGQHVKLTLTRLSSGASKTYEVVSNYNGEFTLPINLARGVYSVVSTYEGTDEIKGYVSSNTIILE